MKMCRSGLTRVLVFALFAWSSNFENCNAGESYRGWNSAIFNVLDFGARGDGCTDDTQAFVAAWAAACKVEASMMVVPSGFVFLVGPLTFSGPYCAANIQFQLNGVLIAPTSRKPWGSGLLQWIQFKKLKGITVYGKGIIDGQGSVWWGGNAINAKMPSTVPTALRFYGSQHVTVSGITFKNSARSHLKFDNCVSVQVFDINISSPGDSPNTDGIHLQNSEDVVIYRANIASGDDCISIQTGCSNVYIHNVNCGPGHGISIGALGEDRTKACVSNITVQNVILRNTKTGVRIKTWQGGSGSVQGILFSNIQVSEVQIPIMIDQFYSPNAKSKLLKYASAVAVSGISYANIRGTYTVKPVHFACSDNPPCTDVSLANIWLTPLEDNYNLQGPFCSQVYGTLRTRTTPSMNCLLTSKPPRINHNSCWP